MNLRSKRFRWWHAPLGLAVVGVIDYWAFPYGTGLPGTRPVASRNGLWLRYSWYFGEHSTQELNELGPRLRKDQITYAYFHVRNIDRNGRLVYRKEKSAIGLNEALYKSAPTVKRIAWEADGLVDWNRHEIRKQMVSEAVWLVRTCGFDGVQWDCEIAHRHDLGISALLRETKAALGKDAFVGFAAPMWLPQLNLGWDSGSYTKIGRACDQIALMAYDTGAYHPRVYAHLVAAQRDQVARALKPTDCRLMIGVPTYGAGLPSHNPRAENLSTAIRGVRMGLEPIEGIALFADYTTTSDEWATYRKDWLGR